MSVRDGGLGGRCASTLALSAFLASADSTTELQTCILPKESAETPYELVSSVLKAWITLTNAEPPTGTAAHRQKSGIYDLLTKYGPACLSPPALHAIELVC